MRLALILRTKVIESLHTRLCDARTDFYVSNRKFGTERGPGRRKRGKDTMDAQHNIVRNNNGVRIG